jgi:L-asparagine transporter-like permease
MWLFPWASYAALAGMAAVLIAMALTPGELSTELHVSVLALAIALAAFYVVDARRRTHAARLGPAVTPQDQP